MWLSKWQDGQSLRDVLNRCVPMYLKVLSVRPITGSKPKAEVTAVVAQDVPYGSLKRECAAINGLGLTELTAGKTLMFYHYDDDRTMQMVAMGGALQGANEQPDLASVCQPDLPEMHDYPSSDAPDAK